MRKNGKLLPVRNVLIPIIKPASACVIKECRKMKNCTAPEKVTNKFRALSYMKAQKFRLDTLQIGVNLSAVLPPLLY